MSFCVLLQPSPVSFNVASCCNASGPSVCSMSFCAKFIKAVSVVPAHAAKRASPSARRAGNCASGSRPLSAKRAVGNCAAGNVHRLAAICKPSKPSEPVSPGLALLGHHHNGWAPKSSIRRSGRGLQGPSSDLPAARAADLCRALPTVRMKCLFCHAVCV